jgi:hypothetical protein
MTPLQVCRDTTLSNEWIIGCAVLSKTSLSELAFYTREASFEPLLRAFLETVQLLLGEQGPEGELLGEVHLAGEVLGYARVLPEKKALLALALRPSSNVGMGWAMLSVAASQLEAQG